MINNVTLVGRLTKDPEYRITPSGVPVAQFSLAVNRTFKSANGEREADYIQCVVFRNQAESTRQYLHRGSLAGVVGRIQTRNYENNEGRRVYVTEIVCDSVQFLEPKNNNGGYQQNNYQSNYNNGGYAQNNGYSSNNHGGGYNNTQQRQNSGYTPPKQQNTAGYTPPQQSQGTYTPPNNAQQSQTPAQQNSNPFDNGIDIKDEDLPF